MLQAPFESLARTVVLLWLIIALAACGMPQDTSEGGVGEDGSGVAPPATVVGVLKQVSDRSITVNGVVFDQSRAAVVDGFDNPMPRDQLKLGMWLQVEGSVDDTGKKGEAALVKVRPALRGIVTARSVSGLHLTVLGSTANLRASNVVYDGISRPGEIQVGDAIELHGPLGSKTGQINASRVELIEKDSITRYELRGKVSKLDAVARTMMVGNQAVRFDAAQVAMRHALINDQTVRVSSSTAPVHGQPWPIQRMVMDQTLPTSLSFFYVEGFTNNLVPGPVFSLEDVRVDATTADGREKITDEGLNVAAFGSLEKGKMTATSVAIVTPGKPVVFKLTGPIHRFERLNEFKVRGTWVDGSRANVIGGDASKLDKGTVVSVEGTLLERELIATRIEVMR